jgi:hypothetical protein
MARTLLEELNDLHASYVEAVNHAVAEDDLARADELAHGYDSAAILLVAEREGKAHLLPIRRPVVRDSHLRRLIRRRSSAKAA